MSSAVVTPTTITLQESGALSTGTGVLTVAAPHAGKVIDAVAAVGTAPVGADLIFDVNADGTSVYAVAGDRLTVADGAQAGSAVATAAAGTVTVAKGDLITVDIDQVGSGTAGSDLTITLVLAG